MDEAMLDVTVPCNLYRPFHGEIVTGAESSFEQVGVNLKDLNQLQRQISMTGAVNVVALFGERTSVIATARRLLGDDALSLEESAIKNGSFYAVVKGSSALFMVIADKEFLHQEGFNKEHILVTLFRYLEDLSPVVLLCPEVAGIEKLWPGPKNPFSSVAHARSKFKLEETSNAQINEAKINTSIDLLTRDLGNDALNQLVLNDNGSKYFMHVKLQDIAATKVDPNSVLQKLDRLLFRTLQHTGALGSEIKTAASELPNECIATLVEEHRRLLSQISEKRNQFGWSFRNTVHAIKEALHLKRFLIMRIISHFTDTRADSYQSVTDFMCDSFLSDLLDSYDIEKNSFSWDPNKAYHECIHYATQFLENYYKEENLIFHVKAEFNASSFQYVLTDRANDIKTAVKSFFLKCHSIIVSECKKKKSTCIVRLTPCVLNVIQKAEGDCEALTYAPLSWNVDISGDVLFSMLPQGFRKNRRSSFENTIPDEIIRGLRVTTCYPLWNGKLFLITLHAERLSNLTILAAVSTTEIKQLKIWNTDNAVIAYDPAEKTSDSILIGVVEKTSVTFFELTATEVLKPTEKGNYDMPSQISGRIRSCAILSSRKEMLVLTEYGNVFHVDFGKKEATELCYSQNTGKRVERKKPTSKQGDSYKSVHVTKNQNFFILCNDVTLDIYDFNLVLLRSIQHNRSKFVKLFWDSANAYVSFPHENYVTSFAFQGLCSDISLRALVGDDSKKEALRGNPVVDIIHASYLKYGPYAQFIGSPETVDYKLVVPAASGDLEKNLRSYLRTFSPKIAVEIDEIQKIYFPEVNIPSDRIRSILLSRVPLHICTIEDNNVVPLIDGKRHQFNSDVACDIANLAERVTFGHLESVLSTMASDRPVKIISIIGRQSSGKSYLLNRLFGTRFSVAATRCTDGIWMSYARLFREGDDGERDFVILDCEGLFSISRNELEEVKLLTVLSAVSDVTILNQDLAFNRHLNRLFSDLNDTVDRVKGKNYFRGLLMMAVRDVASEEGEKAAQEFERNIVLLNQRGDHKFLARLFSRALVLQCLNSYTNRDVFLNELDDMRTSFMEDTNEDLGLSAQRWSDASTVLQSLKIVLLQVNRDDDQAGDEHVKRMKMLQVENRILSAWGDMSKLEIPPVYAGQKPAVLVNDELDNSEDVDHRALVVPHNEVSFKLSSECSDDLGFDIICSQLMIRFFGSPEPSVSKTIYNDCWVAFNDVLVNFVAQRIEFLQQFADHEIASLERLLNSEERKNFQTGIREKIRSLDSRFALCLSKCNSCYLKCIERKGHNEATFETRLRIEQRMKDLKSKLPAELTSELNEIETFLASTLLNLEEAKTIRIEIEKREKEAAARDELRNRVEYIANLLKEKEIDENNKAVSISLLMRPSVNGENGDFLSVLANRKPKMHSDLRTIMQPLIDATARPAATLEFCVYEMFCNFSLPSMGELSGIIKKLEKILTNAASFIDAFLVKCSDISAVPSTVYPVALQEELDFWKRFLGVFEEVYKGLSACDGLFDEAEVNEKSMQAKVSAAEQELLALQENVKMLNDQKRALLEANSSMSDDLKNIRDEVGPLKSQEGHLMNSRKIAEEQTPSAEDDVMELDAVAPNDEEFCILSPPSKKSKEMNLNPELAKTLQRLMIETDRLSRYESSNMDSDDESVSETMIKAVRERVENLKAKKTKLELQNSVDELMHSSTPQLVYDNVKNQIVELEKRRDVLEAQIVKNTQEIQDLDRKLGGAQFRFKNFEHQYDTLLATADLCKKQARLFDVVKWMREPLLATLKQWKSEADDIYCSLESEVRMVALLQETKVIASEKEALVAQKKDLENQMLVIIESEAVDILAAKRASAEEKEKELHLEVSKLQFFIDANQQLYTLKKEMETLEKTLECHCNTNHDCDVECSICISDPLPCKLKAGHDGSHVCNKEQHDCPELCEICGKNYCMYAAEHVNPASHKCASTHQCTLPCRFCPNTCSKFLMEDHTIHQCSEKVCPRRCIFCEGRCTGPHDHDETAVTVEDPKGEGDEVKLHLCDKEHRCQQSCEADGICEVHYVEETRYLDHPRNPLEYQYIRPVSNRKKCMHVLPPGEVRHDDCHDCKSEEHKCNQRCIQCGSFCREPFGHTTEHKTVNHRNMEFCYCVAKTSSGCITVEDTVAGKKALRVYEPGDLLIAETCVQQCKRKGRAHFHLIPCKGGDLCGEVVHGSGVFHCSDRERFYPDIDVTYDKFLCRKYWQVQNWALPTDEESLHLCNFYCPSSEHSSADRHFCTMNAWHSHSELARDHSFDCHDFTRTVFHGVDICFCIDATGSMASYIAACKSAIKRIINDVTPQVARMGGDLSNIKFGIVAYRDHCDGPLLVQPFDFTTVDQAARLVDGISATGGGDEPEAVMDGLDASVNLTWREGCAKILIHILDSPPHGKHFCECGDSYPAGCPCGKNESTILAAMKSKGIQYYVLPLTNSVNKMINIFENHITVTRKDINAAVELPVVASLIACKGVEDAELTATRGRTIDDIDVL